MFSLDGGRQALMDGSGLFMSWTRSWEMAFPNLVKGQRETLGAASGQQ